MKQIEIKLPKNIDPATVDFIVKDGKVVLTAKDKYVPKFGDIVRVNCRRSGGPRNYLIAIFPDKKVTGKRQSKFFDIASIDKFGYISTKDEPCGLNPWDEIVPATEAEKQELFDKLGAVSLFWDPEKKELRGARWRADWGDIYYNLDALGRIKRWIDYREFVDNELYNVGNYFETFEEAEEYSKKFRELFQNR